MTRPAVNNDIYSTLGDRWYDADDDPVALLRAEARLRNAWVLDEVQRRFGQRPVRVLDIGCGAGFLTNPLAVAGHDVTGVDASTEALDVAARHDSTGKVRYATGDATALTLPDAAFDVVCAMDLLEHVTEPERVVEEATRVLRPGGLFFFHTFDRTWLSWLIVIKGVEWFVRNTPRDMHVLHLFVRPDELRGWIERRGLTVREIRGTRPVLDGAFAKMLLTRRVPQSFRFCFTSSTKMGYTGFASRPG